MTLPVTPRTLVKGILSLALPSQRMTRTRNRDAAYFYSAFLRQLVTCAAAGAPPRLGAVGELGPGTALGMGLAALLAGAGRYVALDVAPYASLAENEAVLDALVALFRARAPIPGDDAYPNLKPRLTDYAFPHALLPEPHLEAALAPGRIEALRQSLRTGHGRITYVAPWDDPAVVEPASLDWIFSQAVLEHVDDVPQAYGAIATWLRPGGLTSHQIDLRSHGTAVTWNGHWACPDWLWALAEGKRYYLINRAPASAHLEALRSVGLEIVEARRLRGETGGIGRDRLALRFRSMSDEDLTTSGIYLIGRRPVPAA